MTRQDYLLVARSLKVAFTKTYFSQMQELTIVYELCKTFEADRPEFDEVKFLHSLR